MARKYTTHIREEKAVELSVTVSGLQDYMSAWLVINNNARTYPHAIYKVRNFEDSDKINVCVPPQEKSNIIDFLEQFGEVEIVTEEKYVVFIDVSCDYDNFDEDYIDEEYVFGEIE